ncbi:uncharacterized protein BYT42DRAFT_584795 [Radiomyces spectabilis]|uniref:uncharacterized protein n=1 Tax=Radiomyces spectabilis TaxID=64574 RepID=UPI0022207FA3|nr:uncharacterized protein BYT42DRAFT_584795 [Radiomyces spectabilis]KAI8369536.1 hypothetical protein BYT42DRAFT_584795 [Radiomyces spectabilis]
MIPDSDEHEAFVYRDKSLAPMHSMLPPPWASTADHYPPLIMHDRRGPRSDDYPYSSKENDSPNNSDHRYHPRRPVLRSAVSELPSSGRVHPPPLSKRYKYSYPYYYMSPSDEENVPLLQHHRFHGRRRRKPSQKQKQTSKSRLLWILSSSIMSFLILWLILIVMANPLTDIEILNISNVLATEKELIFNLQIRARNSNWWAINISQGSLSIFASSHYVPTYCAVSSYSDPLAPLNPHGADPAEFLGTIYELEEPLVFTAAGLFNSVTSTRSCQIQLKAPGTINNDRSGNERWSLLIRYPYELTIRGVLRYRLSRWHPNNQLHSARVCKVSRIDPATGNVTDVTLPGQHICDDSVPFDDPSLVMA